MDDSGISASELTDFRKREQRIKHRGHSILFHDYSNLHPDVACRLVLWISDAIVARGKRNELVLVDVSNSAANKSTLAAFKKATVQNKPYMKKVAVIGAVGVVRFFFDVVRQFAKIERTQAFDTRQEALDWLVEE